MEEINDEEEREKKRPKVKSDEWMKKSWKTCAVTQYFLGRNRK